jgi:hypothetical protein
VPEASSLRLLLAVAVVMAGAPLLLLLLLPLLLLMDVLVLVAGSCHKSTVVVATLAPSFTTCRAAGTADHTQ